MVFSYKLNLSIASLKDRACSSTSSWKISFSYNDWKLAEQKGIWPIEPSILFSHMMHSKHKAAAAASSRPLFFKPSKIMVGCAIHTTKERRRRRWSAGGTLGKTWLQSFQLWNNGLQISLYLGQNVFDNFGSY